MGKLDYSNLYDSETSPWCIYTNCVSQAEAVHYDKSKIAEKCINGSPTPAICSMEEGTWIIPDCSCNNWKKCDKSCGGGTQTRTCTELYGGDCTNNPKSQSCNIDPCPSCSCDKWGNCDKSCGGGTQTRKCTELYAEIVLIILKVKVVIQTHVLVPA